VDEGVPAARGDRRAGRGGGALTLLAVAVGGRGVVDPAEPVLRADDEALLRGRGAFETIRVYGGAPFRLAEHLDRLATSAERIGLPSVNRLELEELARQALEAAATPEAVLRLFWTPTPTALALVSALADHYDALRERGQRLISLRGVRADAPWLLPGVKSTSYAVNMAAEAEARRRGADDAVFVDADGIVLEGPTTNVWWRRGRTLYTPSLELGILAGVTRAAVIELAADAGYQVAEGSYALAELAGAEEAFTSSSVREVMPVVELDDAPIGRGPAADELQAALRRSAEATLQS
jgi:4-amino-4-deoxychorismate lyase